MAGKVRGRYEIVKAAPKLPRGQGNVADVRQSTSSGQLGTRTANEAKVGDVVGRSAKTGRVRTKNMERTLRSNANRVIGKAIKGGISRAVPAAALLQTVVEEGPDAVNIEDVIDKEGNVNLEPLQRGRIKSKVRDIKGPEADEDMEEKKRGGMVYRMKGGKVGMRGCGKALRGYGKAMKGK